MKTIMSIDLGKFKSVSCIYDKMTTKAKYKTIKTNPQELHDLVTENSADIIVFEACSIIGWICDLLDNLGVNYIVVKTNTPEWKNRRCKKKTDKADALWLAQETAIDRIKGVYVPSKTVRQKREFINDRKKMSDNLVQYKNKIRSILERQGIHFPEGKRAWSLKCIAKLREMSRDKNEVTADELWRFSLWTALSHYEFTKDMLDVMEVKLKELNDQDHRVQLLKTVGGVGERVAEAVVAYIDDPHRFKNCKQVSCYLGVTPTKWQSGTIDHDGRISGDGNKMLRSLLIEACWLAIRWNPWVKQTYERIRRGCKTRSKIAIVATARRLFVRLWAMLRDGTEWQMPELNEIA